MVFINNIFRQEK